MKEENKQKILADMYCRIEKLEEGNAFTVEDLFFSEKELPIFTGEKLLTMKTDLKKRVRFGDPLFGTLPCPLTEIKEDMYKKEKPVFHQVCSFSKDTSVQELFHYIKQTLKTSIFSDDTFTLSDLFPGYVWNRLGHSQKVAIGMMLEEYNYTSKYYFARVARTKQKQNIYRGLINAQTKQRENWEDVNMEYYFLGTMQSWNLKAHTQ